MPRPVTSNAKHRTPSQRRVAAFIAKFGNAADLARALTAELGEQVSYWTIVSWQNRGVVPFRWTGPLARCAARRGISTDTLHLLVPAFPQAGSKPITHRRITTNVRDHIAP